MKNFVLLPLIIAAAVGCSKSVLINNPPEDSGQREDPNTGWKTSDLWKGYPFNSKDSTLYIAVVDTSGNRNRLKVFKNWEEYINLELGPESGLPISEDLHHLVQGHIYSESPTDGGMSVFRDGVKIAKLGLSEYLAGILEKGEDIYLLSQKGFSSGFTLYKNGIVIMAKDSGSIFGDLDEPSYAPSGALYVDNGQYHFCHMDDNLHGHIFGSGSPVDFECDNPVLDARMVKGELRLATRFLAGETWKGTRLWESGDGLSVAVGYATFLGDKNMAASSCFMQDYAYPASTVRINAPDADLFFNSEAGLFGVKNLGKGKISIISSLGERILERDYEYLCPRCIKITGRGMLLGLNPLGEKQSPLIRYGGKDWILNWTKGKIIALDISLPN